MMTVQDWLHDYAQAWERKDAVAVATLFTQDCSYLEMPFDDAYMGREGVSRYWSGVTATQQNVSVRIGNPVVAADQRRAAAEFWVTMENAGAAVTLTGILFLRFSPDGLCEELREAWHFADGTIEPPQTWGT
jgi:uncharacterized protein (TIGR02246 family)